MTSKIFRSTLLVAAVVLLCSLTVVVGLLYRHFTRVQVAQLKDELSLAVTGTEQYGNAFLDNVEADRFRITWIDTDGTVLIDTWADQTVMENHADREEIQEALEYGYGSAVRTSFRSAGAGQYLEQRQEIWRTDHSAGGLHSTGAVQYPGRKAGGYASGKQSAVCVVGHRCQPPVRRLLQGYCSVCTGAEKLVLLWWRCLERGCG